MTLYLHSLFMNVKKLWKKNIEWPFTKYLSGYCNVVVFSIFTYYKIYILCVLPWFFFCLFVLYVLFFVENKMVEQTRQRIPVVSLQAGPGEVDTSILSNMNLRQPFNITTVEEFCQIQIHYMTCLTYISLYLLKFYFVCPFSLFLSHLSLFWFLCFAVTVHM